MNRQVYRARWVLPITSPPIERGAIAIEDGRIVGVGPASDISGDSVVDLGDCLLLPGFVNAHTHLEATCYRGLIPPQPLWQWFFALLALRTRPDTAERERAAVAAGAAQSLAAGVTCVGDISRTGINVEALRPSPIRKLCFLELISGASQPPNDVESLEKSYQLSAISDQPEGRSYQPSAISYQPEGQDDHPSSFIHHPPLMVGLSPHALYTVTWDDLVGAAALARRHDVPVTVHVLETPEEAEWLAGGGGFLEDFLVRCRLATAGMNVTGGAIERLTRSGLMDCRPLLAHVNYIDQESCGTAAPGCVAPPGEGFFARLAASRASVAWCPRSHRFFGHAPHRWRGMLAAGVNVCLGTDSLASNESLSILDELRYVRTLAPDFPPHELLAMATIRGAAALRLDGIIGSLEVGKLADFIAMPFDAAAPADPSANLLDGAENFTGVWIGGVKRCEA
jgi:aminodeoxyfutalosine deaminase